MVPARSVLFKSKFFIVVAGLTALVTRLGLRTGDDFFPLLLATSSQFSSRGIGTKSSSAEGFVLSGGTVLLHDGGEVGNSVLIVL